MKICVWETESNQSACINTKCGCYNVTYFKGMKYCPFCGSAVVFTKTRREHLTIRFAGTLPKPETEFPKEGQVFFYLTGERPCGYIEARWQSNQYYIRLLKNGMVHLAEEDVKKWTQWWRVNVLNELKKEHPKKTNPLIKIDPYPGWYHES